MKEPTNTLELAIEIRDYLFKGYNRDNAPGFIQAKIDKYIDRINSTVGKIEDGVEDISKMETTEECKHRYSGVTINGKEFWEPCMLCGEDYK